MNPENNQKWQDVESSLIELIHSCSDGLDEDQIALFIKDGSSISDIHLHHPLEIPELLLLIEENLNVSFQDELNVTENMSLYDLVRIISEDLPCGTTHKVI